MKDAYWRRFRLLRIVDGDTIHATVDLGFRCTTEQAIRLLGIDTPELHGHGAEEAAKAQAAKEFVEDWAREHRHVSPGWMVPWPYLLRSEKGDSFGRWLGVVECAEGHVLNDDLLAAGHAVPYRKVHT